MAAIGAATAAGAAEVVAAVATEGGEPAPAVGIAGGESSFEREAEGMGVAGTTGATDSMCCCG